MIKIGILTTKNDPLIETLIQKIKKQKKIQFILFLAKDKKSNVKKNEKIFTERTGSFFKNLNKKNKKKISLKKYSIKKHNYAYMIKIIKKERISYIYNSLTPNKLDIRTINSVKGIINVHPGILPYYRGCTCLEWSIFNKDPIGLTAHFMNDKYDSGPILRSKFLKFKKKEVKNYRDIRIKIYLEQINLAKKIFELIVKKKLIKKKQDEKKAKFYPVISKVKLNKIKRLLIDKKYIFNKKNLIK